MDAPEFNELEFLRFFYRKAGDAFGPADSDIYHMIREEWEEKTGQTNPEEYHGAEAEDDEE
mgnify:CR=1 FL=1